MSDTNDQLSKVLRAHGQSITRARQTVFAALQGQEPQSMRALVAACADQIDRASVYRTIALFERIGVVRRIHIGWKDKLELADAFHHHHHHLSCTSCGTIIPLSEDAALEERLRNLAEQHNFSIQDHQIEIQGLCQQCQKS